MVSRGIRREHEFGVGTINGVAHRLGVRQSDGAVCSVLCRQPTGIQDEGKVLRVRDRIEHRNPPQNVEFASSNRVTVEQ